MFKIFVVTKYSGFNVTSLVIEFESREAADDAIDRIKALNGTDRLGGTGNVTHTATRLYVYGN